MNGEKATARARERETENEREREKPKTFVVYFSTVNSEAI